MPYREMIGEPCTACEELTATCCRSCSRPVCPRHVATYEFYIPVVECGAELRETCERLHGEAAEHHRRGLLPAAFGWVKRVPNEPY